MKKNSSVNRLAGIVIFCLLHFLCLCQSAESFVWPIDTPHKVTGNFGELRPNHFHMGWDFSTSGKINRKVYAIADGYVSRIKVSAVGYGKALYIKYPNNKLGLYAHLNAYNYVITQAVKQQQNAAQNYEVEFFPDSTLLKVKKGDLIGYSGNSGGSLGPHLHFEIRDHATEEPLNLKQFFKIRDTVKPIVQQIAFFNIADTNAPAFIRDYNIENSKLNILTIQKDSILLQHSNLGFAFSGFDRIVPLGSKNVIYKAQLFIDGMIVFGYTLNKISFADQRYVNEFTATINKIKYQKCFLPQNYPNNFYNDCVNNGRIILSDTNYHQLKLVLYDEQENEQVLQFFFKAKKIQKMITATAKGGIYADCHQNFYTAQEKIFLSFHAGTLYNSTNLVIESSLDKNRMINISPAQLNLASAATISFMAPLDFSTLLGIDKTKWVLRNAGAVYRPIVKNDTLQYSVNTFGRFTVDADTMPPLVSTQLSLKKIKQIKSFQNFSFVVRDHLSGIGKYQLYLNDVWVLAEFDAKNNLLTYFFDAETPLGNLNFKVNVEDRVGNTTIYKYTLHR